MHREKERPQWDLQGDEEFAKTEKEIARWLTGLRIEHYGRPRSRFYLVYETGVVPWICHQLNDKTRTIEDLRPESEPIRFEEVLREESQWSADQEAKGQWEDFIVPEIVIPARSKDQYLRSAVTMVLDAERTLGVALMDPSVMESFNQYRAFTAYKATIQRETPEGRIDVGIIVSGREL
jgi:hypothetical protein